MIYLGRLSGGSDCGGRCNWWRLYIGRRRVYISYSCMFRIHVSFVFLCVSYSCEFRISYEFRILVRFVHFIYVRLVLKLLINANRSCL